MNKDYKIKEFTIDELYVNPDNARFINADELPDEVAAISQLALMHKAHIIKLAKDIALKGLNPNELPIVVPGPDNRFLVMDGNRRISAIKLMTQYKDSLDGIGVDPRVARALSSLQCDIKTVNCVLFENEDQIVNDLLEKLHTSNPGVAQVKWDPQAQDRHQYKTGILSKRLALIEMLRYSQYTTAEAKSVLNQGRWLSLLQRFVKSNEYLEFFGIGFDKDTNIILYLEEPEIIKGLSQLVVDLVEKKASEIAQTAKNRKEYFLNFPKDKIPNKDKTFDPLVIFNVESRQFETTKIQNSKTNQGDSKKSKKSKTSTTTETSSTTGSNTTNTDGNKNSESTSNKKEQNTQSSTSAKGKQSTNERTTLIPKDENIAIKNQRTLDLYNELKFVPINNYINVVSVAFRSLIEFSVNWFLESRRNKWAHNQQITLFGKLEKVVQILEKDYTKTQLEKEIPAIYRSIDSFKAGSCDLNSITCLNFLIHSYNYHPSERDLKGVYNNYSPLLKRIWE